MQIVFDSVSKSYGPISAIKDLSFTVEAGDFVFISGPSGSGKSTIVKLILNQIKADSGDILVNGQNYKTLAKNSGIDLLRRKIGVIFQDYQMINDLNIEENIALNLDIVNYPPDRIQERIDTVIKKVKLQNRRFLFPSQLSGGELQRACLARALSIQPKVILADEPTGNLDETNAWNLIKLLSDINQKEGTTILMTTHHLDFISNLKKKVISLPKNG